MISTFDIITSLVMNKFGRSSSPHKSVRVLQAPNVIVFTKEGDYNFRNHKLCNVKVPTEKDDVTTKNYVDSLIEQIHGGINTLNKTIDARNVEFEKMKEDNANKFKIFENIAAVQQVFIGKVRSEFLKIENALMDSANSLIENSQKPLINDIKKNKAEVSQLKKDIDSEFDKLGDLLKSAAAADMEKMRGEITQVKNLIGEAKKSQAEDWKRFNAVLYSLKQQLDSLKQTPK